MMFIEKPFSPCSDLLDVVISQPPRNLTKLVHCEFSLKLILSSGLIFTDENSIKSTWSIFIAPFGLFLDALTYRVIMIARVPQTVAKRGLPIRALRAQWRMPVKRQTLCHTAPAK
jgi:hypothetical protein